MHHHVDPVKEVRLGGHQGAWWATILRSSSRLEGRQRVLEEGGDHHAMVVDCCIMCNTVKTPCVSSTKPYAVVLVR